MDLTKRDAPSKHLGQYTGAEFENNSIEAERIIKMITPNIVDEAIHRNVLTKMERQLLDDLRTKLETYGRNASVTGRTLFYLRDIKDKLVERDIL